MRSKTQEKVLRVLLKALKPLVHLLLEVGIGHREFSEIAKRAFVDVATQKYGIRGRKTNISRVAVMTGLTRKEVKRIRDFEEDDIAAQGVKPVPASLVLQHWHADKEFQDQHGQPVDLPFIGNDSSFTSLVKKYAGDIPPGALRTELLRSGAIEETSNGKLAARRKTFRFVNGEDGLLWSLERGLFGINLNMVHNYLIKAEGRYPSSDTWPSRATEAMRVRESAVPELREFIRDKTAKFTVEVDDLITKYETGPGDESGDKLVDIFAAVNYYEVPSGR